jgi:DNA-binding IclR family transcriptional regulator
MATVLESNRTKIAKRVIEVFDYFGTTNRSATVMDIVRRYGRPQSSTSELLASLVEMGLLYKDPQSRSYLPTPRLATFGTAAQPEFIRDGRLYAYMDRLAQSTRHTVALFGMVGTHTQVFRVANGSDAAASKLDQGESEALSAGAVGLLLLATLGSEQTKKTLWRLNSEAQAESKFCLQELCERATAFRHQGHAVGASGFADGCQVTAALLPVSLGERPLALGIVYPEGAALGTDALLETLRHGVSQFSPSAMRESFNDFAPFARAV